MKKLLMLLLIIFSLASCDAAEPTADIIFTDFGEIIIVKIEKDNEDEVLVPYDCAMAINDVEYIEFQHSVGVSKELSTEAILNISIMNILIDNNDQYSHLVKIYVLGEEGGTQINIFNDVVVITFVVKLIEPIDIKEATKRGLDMELVNVLDTEQACEDIMGKMITYSIEYEITQKEVVD